MKSNDSTSLWVIGLLFVSLFVVIPLGAYFSSRKQKQPVVNFTARFWRFDLVMLLFLLGMQLAILGIFGASKFAPELLRKPKQLAALLGFGLLFLLACGLVCAYLRLYWSYWQHDRNKGLTFYKGENLLRYWVNDDYTDYAISDVVKRTVHTSKTAKMSFAYTTLTFTNSTELLISCVLCPSDDLAQLLPSIKGTTLRTWLPWLPKAAVLH